MGEHRNNPVAVANAKSRQMVQALDIGESMALLGLQLVPVLDEKRENLVVLLVAMGGRVSDLMPTDPRTVALCELAKSPLHKLRKALGGGGEDLEPGAPVPPEAAEASPPDAFSGLVVVP